MRISLVVFLLLLFATTGKTQSDSVHHKTELRGFPILFYTPETRWAIGAAGVTTFYDRCPQDSLYPSSVGISFVYTQEKQILSYFPYNLYFKNGKWWLYGEVGYYHYNYYFYGIGNDIPSDYREYYGASFARVRFSGLHRLPQSKWYTGLKYAFDKINTFNLDTSGLLYPKTISGSDGGRVSGLGWVFNHDSRDHRFYPTRGVLAEFFFFGEDQWTGSTFNYWRVSSEIAAFTSIQKKHIFGTHFNAVYINGEAPFTHLGMLGGYRRLRGYYEGRYRDKVSLILQEEYRWMFWKRFGLAVFGAAGMVAPDLNSLALQNVRIAGGGGLRFTLHKKHEIHLRADYAWGQGSQGAYLTLGEAF